MLKYALIGWPVAHSLSPPMQLAGFKAAGIEAEYSLMAVPPEDMASVISGMKNNFAGWNCTVPHKQSMMKFLDEIDTTARILGSVNTVVNVNGSLKGYSTDGYGMEVSIKESFGQEVKGNSFLFIGSGGAARAVAMYFAAQGASKIAILNRTMAKAVDLVEQIKTINDKVEAVASSIQKPMIRLDDYNVVIQCTSLGLKEKDPSPLEISLLNKNQLVIDMIYKKTAFLNSAAKLGCKTADGRGMLLHQGVRAWEIWTAKKAPVEAMRQALYAVMS